MKATYKNLKNKISHEGIIIGALPRFYSRESIFSEFNGSNESLIGAGGIRSIVLGYRGNSFLVQFFRAMKLFIRDYYDISHQVDQRMAVYVAEIPKDYPLADKLLNDQNWLAYTKHLAQLAEIAIEQNKKVLLIQYPHRHEVYFSQKQLGVKQINEIDHYVELNLLRKALPKSVVFLDMLPFIKEQWDISKEYIYFEKDGHMNERGHELIAKFIVYNLQ